MAAILALAAAVALAATPASAAVAGHRVLRHGHHVPAVTLHWVPLTPAQALTPHEVTNGAHRLCLDAVASHDGTNGDPVQLWHCHGTPDMEWIQNFRTFQFINVAHGLCLDASASGDGRNGDKVQLWHCTGKSNQAWSTQAGNFQIQNGAHGLCLDANASGDGRNGDKVQLWQCKTEPGHPDEMWS
ncbi:MAG TPA: RICIN domain-containing protein [Streptosporangiaceae bacterium]|nr:RICIN domain-containing protein [Streptosporangiaceae bacterium]